MEPQALIGKRVVGQTMAGAQCGQSGVVEAIEQHADHWRARIAFDNGARASVSPMGFRFEVGTLG
jgi:hypothetical protein